MSGKNRKQEQYATDSVAARSVQYRDINPGPHTVRQGVGLFQQGSRVFIYYTRYGELN